MSFEIYDTVTHAIRYKQITEVEEEKIIGVLIEDMRVEQLADALKKHLLTNDMKELKSRLL